MAIVSKTAQIILILISLLSILSSPTKTGGYCQKAHFENIIESLSLQSDDKITVWIDINATTNRIGEYELPASFSVCGIRWALVTFAPDIDRTKLIWCLAEVEASSIEYLGTIPWIFNVTLVRVGGLDALASTNPKLSSGFQETTERALQYNGTLDTIIWLGDPSQASAESIEYNRTLWTEIAHELTPNIEHLGAKLLADYYEGSQTLSASIPAINITLVAENLLVRKLLPNGPLILETTGDSKYSHESVESRNIGFLGLAIPIVANVGAVSFNRNKKKFLIVVLVTLLFAFTLLSIPIPVKALNVSTTAIRANEVWATGNKGEGVNVSILDTGIDLNNKDLNNTIVDRINIDGDTRDQDVQDTNGHGTHVAGIVAGRGVNNPMFQGVAPDAGIVVVRVHETRDFEPSVREIIDHRAQDNIRILQSSVSTGTGGPGLGWEKLLENPFCVAMDDAVESGIVVVQAAGNAGIYGSKKIEGAGNAFNVITVGATDDNNTPEITDDSLREDSSRGPTGDDRLKPDVVAPGTNIMSVALGTQSYIEMNRTSVAAPHVSGIVALMLHANPNLTPAQVKAILRQTARTNDNLNQLTMNDRGYGIVDAFAAVQLAQNIDNIQTSQMYDAFYVRTPNRDLQFWQYDYLDFTVDAPSQTFGIAVKNVKYHYAYVGGGQDRRLMNCLAARHIWIDGAYYDFGSCINRYLLSGPRIYESGGGWVKMRALYHVGSVRIGYDWYMEVDKVKLSLYYSAGSCWKTLLYIEPNVWGSPDYAYLPSSQETISIEKKIEGSSTLDIRDVAHTDVFLQIEPSTQDNPVTWILRQGYYGNDPDSINARNDEYIYNRNIAIYHQATSSITGGWIHRKIDSLPPPNPTQNDANTNGDAGNTFATATAIAPGSYKGILCNSDPVDENDYYKFYVENDQYLYVTLTSPLGINFDLQLYNPSGNPVASSHETGQHDSIPFKASSPGYWVARAYSVSGEGQYSFRLSFPRPKCAMKTTICGNCGGYNDNFYIPNIDVDFIKVEFLFNNLKLEGDQCGGGGVSPYPEIAHWPDGEVDIRDVYFIAQHMGQTEGMSGWEYMADVIADRICDIQDYYRVYYHFGTSGSYIYDLTGLVVYFHSGYDESGRSPDSQGCIVIPEGSSSFSTLIEGINRGAMITFWK